MYVAVGKNRCEQCMIEDLAQRTGRVLQTVHSNEPVAVRLATVRARNNNNNNNIRLIRRCQNATCYNDMDRTVKKHEVTEVLDC